MKYLLYNPLSNNKRGEKTVEEAKTKLKGKCEVINLIGLDAKSFMENLSSNDDVILVGGDGTLNHFINDIDLDDIHNDIYLYRAGTGNDFLNDIEAKEDFTIINKYLVNLPKVYVNGMTRYFINGIGYGIDGYCTMEGDRAKAKSKKKINYTTIALKGLLFAYKRVNAIVNVDGVVNKYKNVWLAPSMKGRYFGGGMMIAPYQNREEKLLTNVVYFSRSKLKTLFIFPSIFKGKHPKYKNNVRMTKGKVIEVTFDKPTPLQIDGETVLDVLSYKVEA
jgi:diacylglycerol kinase family enzyme